MFGLYDGTKQPLVKLGVNEYLARSVAGMTAGKWCLFAVENKLVKCVYLSYVLGTCEAVLMPFERIQTLLADSHYHTRFKNTSQAFHYVCINHGYRELYRGLTPILLRNGPSNVLFFGMREEAAFLLPKHVCELSILFWKFYAALINVLIESQSFQNDHYRQSAQEFLSGACIGAFLSTVFYPLNVAKVVMQSTMGTPKQSIIDAFKLIYHERDSKIRNIYRGCSINSIRAFVSWGIISVSYEGIKRLIS